MSNENIYLSWSEFINDDKYKKYSLTNEDIWHETFNQVKCYLDFNNKFPSRSDKDNKIKQLGAWISRQKINYKIKSQIMETKEIYDIWTNFINDSKYKKYFTKNNKV